MRAFDTDVLSEVLAGADEYLRLAAAIPPEEQCITVVTADEVTRGLLADVRRSEAGRGSLTLVAAYAHFQAVTAALRQWVVLPYSDDADALYRRWRTAKVGVRPHDLRIAAICVASGAALITRNRRDFEKVPGLDPLLWP